MCYVEKAEFNKVINRHREEKSMAEQDISGVELDLGFVNK